jgi:hypothetical protein
MPIHITWYGSAQRVIHLQYEGLLDTQEYTATIQAIADYMNETAEPVHILTERTAAISVVQSPLSVLQYANTVLPSNIGCVVLVRPSVYARMILTIARSVTPRFVRNLHYAHTVDEGLKFIQEWELERESTSESDE